MQKYPLVCFTETLFLGIILYQSYHTYSGEVRVGKQIDFRPVVQTDGRFDKRRTPAAADGPDHDPDPRPADQRSGGTLLIKSKCPERHLGVFRDIFYRQTVPITKEPADKSAGSFRESSSNSIDGRR